MKILVGSKNPVKISSAKEAFEKFFGNVEALGINVPSGVPDQPVNGDTFKGARNRALKLKEINNKKNLNAEFFVGIEGGISNQYGIWFAFGGMCIIDIEGNEAYGTSPQFELPEQIINSLLNGKELGLIMDEIQSDENTKQKGGAISYFTKGVMNRKELYISGLITALIPFLNKELFFNS